MAPTSRLAQDKQMPMNRKLPKVFRTMLLSALPIFAIATVLAIASTPSSPAQNVDEVVAKVLDARGGLEKAKAVQSERITGVIYFNPEMYGPFLAEFKRPGKMHNEVTVQNKTVVRTIDGKDGGWVINPFQDKTAPEPMSADDVKDAANEADFDGPLVDAKAKGNVIELAGTEKVDGNDAVILKVTRKDGTVSSYSFDAKTYLLAKWSGVDNVNGESVTHETYFHDYRDVNGLKFAFELDSRDSRGQGGPKIVVSKIEIDPQIDDARFGKPAAQSAAPADAPAATPNQANPPGGR